METRIGFIGLGIMGRPMAQNLLDAGFQLVVHSRSHGPVAELVASSNGAAIAVESPRQVASNSDVIITMLPDATQVRTVVFGAGGLLDVIGEGQLLIDLSTISPAAAIDISRAVTERGARFLDAPVSGGDKGAIAGTLSIMVGGDESDFNRALPLFDVLGKTVVHVGTSGAGQTVKACNQIVVAANYAAVSEALVFGAKMGVIPEKIVHVLSGGLAASRVLELRGSTMIRGEYAPGFRVRLHHKDLGIALETARDNAVPMPVTALVGQFFEALMAAGRGDLDHSALLTVFEELGKTHVGTAG